MSRAKMLHKMTCDTLVKLSDQIGAVLAQAHVAHDHETVDTLMPALATVWQLRWEMNITAGDVAGASKEAVAREIEAAERDLDVLKRAAAQREGGAP